MKRQTKKAGRRANKDDRFVTEVLVDVYRKALAEPDGKLILISEQDSEDKCVIDSSDIRPLLDLLDNFAKHGTFKSEKIPVLENIEIYLIFQELRRSGMKYESAVQQVAEQSFLSKSTIERRLKSIQERGGLSSLSNIR